MEPKADTRVISSSVTAFDPVQSQAPNEVISNSDKPMTVPTAQSHSQAAPTLHIEGLVAVSLVTDYKGGNRGS